MQFLKNKKYILVMLGSILLFAGIFNHTYTKKSNVETTKILGEAAYVNNNVQIEENNRLKQIRNDREKTRDEVKETLENIIKSPNSTEQGKMKAEEELIGITKSIQNELDCEILLKQKGFEEVVVTISNNSASVAVMNKTLLNTEIAQITDTVAGITGFDAEKIKILSGDWY